MKKLAFGRGIPRRRPTVIDPATQTRVPKTYPLGEGGPVTSRLKLIRQLIEEVEEKAQEGARVGQYTTQQAGILMAWVASTKVGLSALERALRVAR